MKKRFFTLSELLIVIVVMGVLVSIVMVNISSSKKDALVAMTESNIKQIQSAVDMYQLENNSVFPTTFQPTLEIPSKIDFTLLFPKYLKSLPNEGKLPDQHYWVDSYGKVWGATVDAPKDFNDTGSLIEWISNDKAHSYNVYEVEPKNKSLSKVYNVNVGKANNILNKEVTRFQIPKPEYGVLISAVDQYGFETAPVGLTYNGMPEDWFQPLIDKEGVFTIQFGESSLMYWDRFWVDEIKPNGTNIQYEFSTSENEKDWTPYTPNFNSLSPSKNIRIKVTMIGFENQKPSLLDMRVDFHFEDEKLKTKLPNLLPNKELPAQFPIEGESVDGSTKFENAELEFYSFTPSVGENVSNVSVPYNNSYQEVYLYTLNELNNEFVHHPSLSNIPHGKTIYISVYTTHKDKGSLVENAIQPYNSPLVFVSKEIIQTEIVDFSENPLPKEVEYLDSLPELNDPNWKNIGGFNLFFFSGETNSVDWIDSTIVDQQPEHTRINYYYMSNSDSGWSEPYDSISKVPNSRALKVAVVLQVEKAYSGKVEPIFTSMAIRHNKGVVQSKAQGESILLLSPQSASNPNNQVFNKFTPIDWKYFYEDSSGRSVFSETEWKLNDTLMKQLPTSLPEGTHKVSIRIKSLEGKWTNWTDEIVTITPAVFTSNLEIENYAIAESGTYMIEVFGAAGGGSTGISNGSYISSEIDLTKDSVLTLYSGKVGEGSLYLNVGGHQRITGSAGGGSSAILLNQELLVEASGGTGNAGSANSYGTGGYIRLGGLGYNKGGNANGTVRGEAGGVDFVSSVLTSSQIQKRQNSGNGKVVITRIK